MNKKIDAIFARHKVEFAYLFGSRATGNATPQSDYDIAVFLPDVSKKSRFEKRVSLSSDISKLLGATADIVVLNDLHSTLLRHVIIDEGKLIYNKNEEKRLDFELHAMREYDEFSPFIKAYNEQYLKNAA